MTNTRDIVLKLKQVREEKGLSYSDIMDMLEKNGDFLAKSTIARVFSDGSENLSFRYEETLRPLANVLLDIENVEDDDTLDVQALKTLLKFKIQRIEELEKQIESLESALDKEKVRSAEKLEEERAQHEKSIEFLKNQVELKDKRMDMLLEAVFTKDNQHKELLDLILTCPARNGNSCQ